MSTLLKRALIPFVVFLLLFLIFWLWYVNTYSMDEVKTYEIGDTSSPSKVLVATQGSAFKEHIVNGFTDKFNKVYFKITDVDELSKNHKNNWDAIVILHTWEYGKPPKSVERFMQNNPSPNKCIVFTTSGKGTEKITGIDAISGASDMAKASLQIEEITRRLAAILFPPKL